MAELVKSLRETCGKMFSGLMNPENTRAVVEHGGEWWSIAGGGSTSSWTWGLGQGAGTREEAHIPPDICRKSEDEQEFHLS